MNESCPACGSQRKATGGNIAFCQCGHRWLKITRRAHREQDATIYSAEYAGYISDPVFQAFARKFTQTRLVACVPPPAQLLDIGCGAGDFLLIAKEAGYQTTGFDISSAAVELCRKRGLNASSGDLMAAKFPHRFDVITMWDVVEHLYEPYAVLKLASGLLSDRGILFAKVPAFGNFSVHLSNAVPRLQGALLGAPGHVQYFTGKTLELLVERVGLQPQCDTGGRIRSQRRAPLRRRLVRGVRDSIKAISGDHNLFLIAKQNTVGG